jgi:hypothetical protein
MSEDGLIEAAERPRRRPGCLVQWHPEETWRSEGAPNGACFAPWWKPPRIWPRSRAAGCDPTARGRPATSARRAAQYAIRRLQVGEQSRSLTPLSAPRSEEPLGGSAEYRHQPVLAGQRVI